MTHDLIVEPLLKPLIGQRVAGGCDHCHAYQTVAELRPTIWQILIHHDDDCPAWREIRAARLSAPTRLTPATAGPTTEMENSL